MIEYPKIETLYNRDAKTFKVLPDDLRCAEFGNVKRWSVTEKVDGTNVRIGYRFGGEVQFGGRTDNAQMPTTLVNYLRRTFTAENMAAVFATTDADVTLFGEGYGGNIQKGGIYRPDPSFRLFDVRVGEWWLEPESVSDIASLLGISTVPTLLVIGDLPRTADDLKAIIPQTLVCEGGTGGRAEGIVARTYPLMLNRRGERIMWKLKFKDF